MLFVFVLLLIPSSQEEDLIDKNPCLFVEIFSPFQPGLL